MENQTRRIFLKSTVQAVGLISINGAHAAENEGVDLCDYYAGKLSDALRQKHGGNWSINIHPQNAYVMFVR